MTVFELFSHPANTHILMGVLWGFIALLVGVIFATIRSRMRNNRISRNINRYFPEFLYMVDAVRDGLVHDDRIKETLNESNFEYFARFLRDEVRGIDEDQVHVYRHIANVSGFLPHIREQIGHSRMWTQSLNIRTLSYFRCKEDVPLFQKILDTATFGPVIIAAGLGLAYCDEYQSMEVIFDKIYNSDEKNEDMLMLIISAYGDDASPYLHKLLTKELTDNHEKCIITDALAYFRYELATETMKRMLKSDPEPELGIRLMSAMMILGDENDTEELLPFLKSPYYEMRSRTLFTLAALGGEQMVPHIEPLIDDKNSWVRRYAAEALLDTGRQGLVRLREIRETGSPEARTTADSVLTDMEFGKLGMMESEL